MAGDINVAYTEAMIKQLFGPFKNQANQAAVINEPVPDNEQPIIIVDKDKERANSVVGVLFKHEAWPDSLKGNMNYVIANYARSLAIRLLHQRFAEGALNADCPYIGASARTLLSPRITRATSSPASPSLPSRTIITS